MTTDIEALHKIVDELAAKEAIREMLYKYTRGMDRIDPETAKSVYHPDADDLHWGWFLGNSQRFVDYILGELKAAKFVIHEITNPLIELDGDRAFVESRYTARLRFEVEDSPEGTWLESIAHGRYLDVFERPGRRSRLARAGSRHVQPGRRRSSVPGRPRVRRRRCRQPRTRAHGRGPRSRRRAARVRDEAPRRYLSCARIGE